MGVLATRSGLNTLRRGCSDDLRAVRRGRSRLSTGRCVVTKLYALTTVLVTTLTFLTFLIVHFVLLGQGLGGVVRAVARRDRRRAKFVRDVSTRVRPALSRVDGSMTKLRVATPERTGTVRTHVSTLGRFKGRVRRLSLLGGSLLRACRTRSFGIDSFYRGIVRRMGRSIHPSIRIATSVPGVRVGAGTRRLRHVLLRLLEGTTVCAASNGVGLRFGGGKTRVYRFVIASDNPNVPIRGRVTVFGPFARVGSLASKSKLKLPVYSLVTSGVGNALSVSPRCGGNGHFVLMLRIWPSRVRLLPRTDPRHLQRITSYGSRSVLFFAVPPNVHVGGCGVLPV